MYSRTQAAPRSANEALLRPSFSLTWVKLRFMATRNRNRPFDLLREKPRNTTTRADMRRPGKTLDYSIDEHEKMQHADSQSGVCPPPHST